MDFTVGKLAEVCKGRVVGKADLNIRSLASVDEAGEGELTYVVDEKRLDALKSSKASAAVVPVGMEGKTGLEAEIVAENPKLAFAKICELYVPPLPFDTDGRKEAYIAPGAEVSPSAIIAPMAFIGDSASIGDGTVVYPLAYVGERARVGRNCRIYPQVFIGQDCQVGDRVVLNPGVKIGGEGFGFVQDGAKHVKLPHLGSVIIGDDVEVGANSTIDRGTLGSTKISRGTKIDNLVMIGHNVEVGEDSLLVAQVGLAGSAKIGNQVILGGQTGANPGVEIGDGVIAGARSGLTKSIKAGEKVAGLPIQPYREWLKTMNLIKKLPAFDKKLKEISKALSKLEDQLERIDDKPW